MPKSRSKWKLVREHCDFEPVMLIQERGKHIILGRAKADVVCDSPFASRHHCTITFRNNLFYVRDLNSTNGTYLNGTKILKQTDRELRHNDLIGVGVGESPETECTNDYFFFRVLKFDEVRDARGPNTEVITVPDEEEEEGALDSDSDGTTGDIDEAQNNLDDSGILETSASQDAKQNSRSSSPDRGTRIAPPPPKISTSERGGSTTRHMSIPYPSPVSSSYSSSKLKNNPLISSTSTARRPYQSTVHNQNGSERPSTSRTIRAEYDKQKIHKDSYDRNSESTFVASPLEDISDDSSDGLSDSYNNLHSLSDEFDRGSVGFIKKEDDQATLKSGKPVFKGVLVHDFRKAKTNEQVETPSNRNRLSASDRQALKLVEDIRKANEEKRRKELMEEERIVQDAKRIANDEKERQELVEEQKRALDNIEKTDDDKKKQELIEEQKRLLEQKKAHLARMEEALKSAEESARQEKLAKEKELADAEAEEKRKRNEEAMVEIRRQERLDRERRRKLEEAIEIERARKYKEAAENEEKRKKEEEVEKERKRIETEAAERRKMKLLEEEAERERRIVEEVAAARKRKLDEIAETELAKRQLIIKRKQVRKDMQPDIFYHSKDKANEMNHNGREEHCRENVPVDKHNHQQEKHTLGQKNRKRKLGEVDRGVSCKLKKTIRDSGLRTSSDALTSEGRQSSPKKDSPKKQPAFTELALVEKSVDHASDHKLKKLTEKFDGGVEVNNGRKRGKQQSGAVQLSPRLRKTASKKSEHKRMSGCSGEIVFVLLKPLVTISKNGRPTINLKPADRMQISRKSLRRILEEHSKYPKSNPKQQKKDPKSLLNVLVYDPVITTIDIADNDDEDETEALPLIARNNKPLDSSAKKDKSPTSFLTKNLHDESPMPAIKPTVNADTTSEVETFTESASTSKAPIASSAQKCNNEMKSLSPTRKSESNTSGTVTSIIAESATLGMNCAQNAEGDLGLVKVDSKQKQMEKMQKTLEDVTQRLQGKVPAQKQIQVLNNSPAPRKIRGREPPRPLHTNVTREQPSKDLQSQIDNANHGPEKATRALPITPPTITDKKLKLQQITERKRLEAEAAAARMQTVKQAPKAPCKVYITKKSRSDAFIDSLNVNPAGIASGQNQVAATSSPSNPTLADAAGGPHQSVSAAPTPSLTSPSKTSMISASAFLTRRKEASTCVSEDRVFKDVLQWNPDWLTNSKFDCTLIMADNERLVSNVPIYRDYETYRNIYYPLMLLELWENISQDYKLHTRRRNDKGLPDKGAEQITFEIGVEEEGTDLDCPMLPPTSFGQALVNGGKTNPSWYWIKIMTFVDSEDNADAHNDFGTVTLQVECETGEFKTKTFFGFFLKGSEEYEEVTPSTKVHTALFAHSKMKALKRSIKFMTSLGQHKLIPEMLGTAHKFACIWPMLRNFRTVIQLSNTPLFQNIVLPSEVQSDSYSNITNPSLVKRANEILARNPSQKVIVQRVASKILFGKSGELQLVSGSPGAGKSTTIVGLTLELLKSVIPSAQKRKLLICAPSRFALDVLLHKFKSTKALEGLTLVRVGEGQEHVCEYDLMEYVDKHIGGDGSNVKRISDKIRKIDLKIASITAKKSDNCSDVLQNELKTLKTDRESSKIALEECVIEEREIMKKILLDSDIICSTLSSCLDSLLQSEFGESSTKGFTCCIVDDATQATEPETLAPLFLKCDKLVLFGDPKLRATVGSKAAGERGYNQSLFSRLFNFYQSKVNSPVHVLDRQMRMHPQILRWPNSRFYEGKMLTHESVSDYPRLSLQPYVFLDVSTSGYPNVSLYEAVVRQVLLTIKRQMASDQELAGLEIGILTTNPEHKEHILRSIDQLSEREGGVTTFWDSIEVNTVAMFQGRESDIVILFGVQTEQTGQLMSNDDLNIALTRAKRSLLIVGNGLRLKQEEIWTSLIDDARRRNCYETISELEISKPEKLRHRIEGSVL